MPWLTIFMAVLAFFITKKNTGSTSKAALAAALAGGGTYAVTHDTDWGRANLGEFDGVVPEVTIPGPNGTPIQGAPGATVGTTPETSKGGSGLTLPAIGGTGAGVAVGAGVGAVLGGMNPIVLIGAAIALFLLLKD